MRNLLAFILFFSTTLLYAGDGNPDAIIGNWVTQDGDAKIEIYKCGDNYCGKIVWLKNPTDKNGKPKLDDKNKDKSLRNRPLIGLQVMESLDYNYTQGHDVWNGTAYNPKWGKKASGMIRTKKDGTLAVKGWEKSKKKVGSVWTRDVKQTGGIKPSRGETVPKSGGK